jgi:signal transduction histidine kinase
VQLSALGKGAATGLRSLKTKIAHTQRLVEHSVNEVHRFARELRPAVLDDLGLIPALLAYSKSLAARKRIKIRLTTFAGVESLSDTKRTMFFRVAQEALTNVVRHAQATQAEVVITKVDDAVRMEVRDNGKSFAVETVLHARTYRRLGLVGMRERIEMVGGRLVIESEPGRGTIIRAEIPFETEKKIP